MFFKRRRKQYKTIDPDEIFMDSYNLPGFDNDMFEGRIERPITGRTLFFLSLVFILIVITFSTKIFNIQIINGKENIEKSQNNILRHTLIFPDRGIIYDRKKEPLVWNENAVDADFQFRKYTDRLGFAHILGYVSYPKKDSSGIFYESEIKGVFGVEKFFNEILAGKNGLKIVETSAINKVISDSRIEEPVNGENLMLTIDADIQEHLNQSIREIVDKVGFNAGGGAIMDIKTGEIIAMTSYPEFESNVMTEAKNKEKINEFLNNKRNPFLNRITQGLYTPGSIMKPYVALGGLQEGVINENTIIVSEGKLVIPNPYNPDNPSIFTDWKAHGPVNIIKALAMSSNIYFYQVGGGYKNQRGLGITNLAKYYSDFGFGREIKNEFFNFEKGLIPDPDWKKEVFNDDWRLGDTYFTAIGQYAVQVTPIQALRAVASIANNGIVVEPKIIADPNDSPQIFNTVDIDEKNFEMVKRGMREVVLTGTAKGLNSPYYEIAAKTGTAELGVSKEKVNSWTMGFFPYKNPKYAFVIILEKGDRTNLIGGVAVSKNFFDWLYFNKPEYLK